MSLEEQQKLEDKYLMHTINRLPVEFVRGSGMHLWDDKGKQYTDFLGGIAVCSLGHCDPDVVKAVQDQATQLMHVSNYFYIEHRGEVAKELSDLLDREAPVDKATGWETFFANSGAEANECAIKLVRMHAHNTHSGATKIVVLKNSFHGRTMETLAATAQPEKQEAFQPIPGGFIVTPINDLDALQHLFDQEGNQIAGMLVECIQGESGVHPCTPEFLQKAEELTHSVGGLFVCDEVQCGMFRTGRAFGFQNYGIVPDVVAMAKAIANGFPMGACAARGEAADDFGPGDHGSTFGGSNLAIAACAATLPKLADPALAKNVQTTGAYLCEQLAKLPAVVQVRGLGLMVGCDLDEKYNAFEVVSKALDEGFVLNATGPSTLRFVPPLICSISDIDELIVALGKMLV
ncbi:MAG: acetylornithine/succinylornithine family transaminase [Coriobacteriaceae bacterium]